jgi:hypothetical protein
LLASRQVLIPSVVLEVKWVAFAALHARRFEGGE